MTRILNQGRGMIGIISTQDHAKDISTYHRKKNMNTQTKNSCFRI